METIILVAIMIMDIPGQVKKQETHKSYLIHEMRKYKTFLYNNIMVS